MTCCSQFVWSWRGNSPFTENIVLGYYDGPTRGIIRCGKCGTVYSYKTLAWDDGQDTRLFAFYHLPSELFEQLEQLLKKYSSPRYPDWVILWHNPIDEDKEIENVLRNISLESKTPAYLVVSTTLSGTLQVWPVDETITKFLNNWLLQNQDIGNIEEWHEHLGL